MNAHNSRLVVPDMLLLGRKRAEAFSRESLPNAKPHVNLRRE
jgi:hypothetical protein